MPGHDAFRSRPGHGFRRLDSRSLRRIQASLIVDHRKGTHVQVVDKELWSPAETAVQGGIEIDAEGGQEFIWGPLSVL